MIGEVLPLLRGVDLLQAIFKLMGVYLPLLAKQSTLQSTPTGPGEAATISQCAHTFKDYPPTRWP